MNDFPACVERAVRFHEFVDFRLQRHNAAFGMFIICHRNLPSHILLTMFGYLPVGEWGLHDAESV